MMGLLGGKTLGWGPVEMAGRSIVIGMSAFANGDKDSIPIVARKRGLMTHARIAIEPILPFWGLS